MEVSFRTNQLQRNYEESNRAIRKWGADAGRMYITRINQIYAANDFGELYELHALRLHPLVGDRQGDYSIDLADRWRLIVAPSADGRALLVKEVNNHYGD